MQHTEVTAYITEWISLRLILLRISTERSVGAGRWKHVSAAERLTPVHTDWFPVRWADWSVWADRTEAVGVREEASLCVEQSYHTKMLTDQWLIHHELRYWLLFVHWHICLLKVQYRHRLLISAQPRGPHCSIMCKHAVVANGNLTRLHIIHA